MLNIEKAKRKVRGKWISFIKYRKIYYIFYRSFWYSKLKKYKYGNTPHESNYHLYFAACPNYGAGIGHQMANWIAGYWFAKVFRLEFAHIPFSSEKWENFLGFYHGEKTVKILRDDGYRVVRLPIFHECSQDEVAMIKSIIQSYSKEKVIFLAEQDQFYYNQYGVMNQLQDKFYSAPSRRNDKLIYDKKNFNIAIHVRRGDIVQKSGDENPNLSMRFQSNDYFFTALQSVLEYLKDKENIHIYLFSQGKKEDYPEFAKISDLHFAMDMDAQESFLHMVYADALITSKSSFSYKPALLNRGIKFCPKNFWHGYPDSVDWILLDESGNICT